MHIQILGSAAGGGFPQWNCNCANCAGFRDGSVEAKARTQSSIAISDDGVSWVLCNASPDIRAQLQQFAPFQPGRALRDTGIAAIVLMDSQIDHTTGLLSLREGCPLDVWCTDMVHEDLSTGFPLFTMLSHWNGGLRWNPVEPERAFTIAACPNLRFTPFVLQSAAPPYSPASSRSASRRQHRVGDRGRAQRRQAVLRAGPGAVDEALASRMAQADCLLLDGTLWHDDEMQRRGVGTRTGRQMGHLAQSGPGGMLEVLERFPAQRKILTHINNTNPILDERSPERAELARRQVEVAFDGMRIDL